MSKVIEYPFTPKSTAYLESGQFWMFGLSNGLKACGLVLQLKILNGARDSRMFLAGLLDWTGTELPAMEILEKHALIAHGQAHVKTISENGGVVAGKIGIENSSLTIPLTLDESPNQNCRLRKGFDFLGVATAEQQQSLESFKTWGYGTIKVRAEKTLI